MSERWFDSDGIEWDSWSGIDWPVGRDANKKVKRTPEEERGIDDLLKKWDEEDAKKPIRVSAPRNVLSDLVDEIALGIATKELFEKATGREVQFGKHNLQFPKESKS